MRDDLLDEMRSRQETKFREIATMIAADLGYGAFGELDPKRRAALELEAEEAILRWEHDAEMQMQPIEPKTPLQRLLREHHDIGETILDIRKEEDNGAGDADVV
jgi:hypothetical protein